MLIGSWASDRLARRRPQAGPRMVRGAGVGSLTSRRSSVQGCCPVLTSVPTR
jgi:hypothetical protein